MQRELELLPSKSVQISGLDWLLAAGCWVLGVLCRRSAGGWAVY